MTQSEKIDKIYDICIKMEPVVNDLKDDYYGKDGNPGTQMDVDRLKVFKGRASWFIGACILVWLGVAGKLIYAAIINHVK